MAGSCVKWCVLWFGGSACCLAYCGSTVAAAGQQDMWLVSVVGVGAAARGEEQIQDDSGYSSHR